VEEIHIIIKGARATLFAFLFFRFFAKEDIHICLSQNITNFILRVIFSFFKNFKKFQKAKKLQKFKK